MELYCYSSKNTCKSMEKKCNRSWRKILGGDPNKPGEACDIPGIGLYCSFIDTECNRVSMLQHNPLNK